MHRGSVVHTEPAQPIDQCRNPLRPVGRMAIRAEIVGSVRDHAVVGGHDQAPWRIDHHGHLVMGDPPLPLALRRPARHRQPAIGPRPPRHPGADQVPDPAVHVASDQVVVDQAPAPRRLEQRWHGPGQQHPRQAIEREVRLRELHGPERERRAMCGITGNHGSVAGFGYHHHPVRAAADGNGFRTGPHRFPPVADPGAAGFVELLKIEVVDVHERVRDAARDVPVVHEVLERRDARHRQADRVERVAGEVMLRIHPRHLERPVRVPGQDGPPRGAPPGADRPVVAAAPRLVRTHRPQQRRNGRLQRRKVRLPALGGDVWRYAQQVVPAIVIAQLHGLPGAHDRQGERAPQLEPDGPHQQAQPPHDRDAVPWLPRLGGSAQQAVFHRQARA